MMRYERFSCINIGDIWKILILIERNRVVFNCTVHFSGERSVHYNIMNYKLEITAIAARALSIDDMSRLEPRRTLYYIYTVLSSECPFGMGISGRRPLSCSRGAPTVLKGAEAAVRIAGTGGSKPPEMDEAAGQTVAAAKIPSETVCCMDGT